MHVRTVLPRSASRYHYDDLNRLTQLANSNGAGEALSTFTYTLGLAGNREAVTEDIDSNGTTRQRIVAYDYDWLYRLSAEWIDEPGGGYRDIIYDYDDVGNRTAKWESTPTGITETVYAFNWNDELEAEYVTTSDTAAFAPQALEDYYAAMPPPPSRWPGVVLAACGALTFTALWAPLLLPSRGRFGRRARRRRRFTACIATFLLPLMVLDPQSVDAMFNEAMAYQTMTAAGIAQVGPTGNATVAYTYDDNGNLHQRYESGDLAATYTFDAENRLVAYVPTTGDAAAYNYDADGIRNSRTVAGVTTWHLTDKNRPYAQVLTETDAATGALRVRYTYGADLISQTRPDPADPHANPPVTRYYHYDGQMSTRQLTDAAEGAATAITDTSVSSLSPPSSVGVGHTAYDAYGNLLAETGETLNAYRYTGEQFDDAIGQYYLRARYYDQAAGRFVSHDPIVGSAEDPRSLHSYLYAHSDPVNRCDPSGMCTLVGLMATTAIIGAIAGVLVGAYVGVKKTGTLLSWTSIKYMVIGLIGGAAIGALIGGALYFSAAGVLRILQAGMRAFWTKLLNPGGHTKSARAAVAGFGLGFVAGLIDPDVIVSIASVGATIAIMLNDFVVRGSMYGRRATAAVVGSYFVQYARLFIFRYIQSTTFIAFAFSFGFAAGHFTGASIRRFYDRL